MTHSIGEPQQHNINDLNLYHQNPRTGDTQAIAQSLKTNGAYKPIVVNRGTHTGRPNEVLAGNHTVKAHRLLIEQGETGWDTIATWVVDVDDEHATRIVLADNRTADLGEYNNDTLLELLGNLNDGIEGTGYDDGYIDALLGMNTPEQLTDPDETPELDDTPTIAQPGHVYQLGNHRVLCGDATDPDTINKKLLHDGTADCIWTDPPYGVSYVGKTKDSLTIQNDGSEGLPDLLNAAMKTIVQTARPGAPVYVAHADTERITFETAMTNAGILVRQNLIWVKNTIVMGRSDYHYKHEPILYGFTPGAQGRLGRGGDQWHGDNKQSTVFEYDKPGRNAEHPTMKPVELIQAMIDNSCKPKGIILDIFAGSGSTLIAAHHSGKTARLVELDPRYVDVICRRWEQHTGITPTRDGQEVTFL